MIIPYYPEGSDITVLDTHYIYPKKKEEGKGYEDDIMQILYRDNTTGKKAVYEEHNPTYTFYMANEDIYVPEDQNLFFIDREDVEEVTVPYKDLLKVIAEMTDNTEFFYDNIKRGDRRANEQLHFLNNIFGSDVHIEDHYRHRFDREYTNNTFQVSKGYFDIEVDTKDMEGDFPEMGECPINAVSYINSRDKCVSLFLLRDENNPQIDEFEKELARGTLLKELQEFVIDHVGGYKVAKYRHKIHDYTYQVYMYDEEILLLRDLFALINYDELDFMLAWNMPFDFPYIVERIKKLGYVPEDIMCHPASETRQVKYYIDQKNKNVPAQKGDYFYVSGRTIYLDQLVQFSTRRKGQSLFENNKLDYIGWMIAKVRKLDWSGIAKTFEEFIRKAYKMFAFYNVMDTLVQHCIENKINDIDYVFNKALINNTRYSKCQRQTVYLANRFIKEAREAGYVVSNNVNRANEKPKEKFSGAIVGDPRNNSDYPKLKINGKAINIGDNLDDFDYKSLYPSIMREFGIAPNTQIGKIIIDRVIHELENPFKYAKYDRGSQMLEDLHSQNYIEFCKRWLHLAGYKEMIQDMREFFTKCSPMGTMDKLDRAFVKFNVINQGNEFVTFNKTKRVDPFIYIHEGKRDFTNEINILNQTAQMDLDSIEKLIERRKREEEEDEELAKEFGLDEILERAIADNEVLTAD